MGQHFGGGIIDQGGGRPWRAEGVNDTVPLTPIALEVERPCRMELRQMTQGFVDIADGMACGCAHDCLHA
jgi:hypothetical protein